MVDYLLVVRYQVVINLAILEDLRGLVYHVGAQIFKFGLIGVVSHVAKFRLQRKFGLQSGAYYRFLTLAFRNNR